MKALKNFYINKCRQAYALATSPSNAHIQLALFVMGVALVTAGLVSGAIAQVMDDGEVNAERINYAVQKIFKYIEGSFGMLIMVVSGLGAIMSSAFGQYKAALGCLVVAVGSFILRSVASTFFNTEDVLDD